MTHLIQLLLPLYDRTGRHFRNDLYEQVARELTERFGGITAYTRAPATGLWEDPSGRTARDEIVVYEVMVEFPDADWWAAYRRELEGRFDQEELVIRAQEIQRF